MGKDSRIAGNRLTKLSSPTAAACYKFGWGKYAYLSGAVGSVSWRAPPHRVKKASRQRSRHDIVAMFNLNANSIFLHSDRPLISGDYTLVPRARNGKPACFRSVRRRGLLYYGLDLAEFSGIERRIEVAEPIEQVRRAEVRVRAARVNET
ncbi:hypothetical protein BH24PSE2_BH24PSE2_20010 [soil metagenome]